MSFYSLLACLFCLGDGLFLGLSLPMGMAEVLASEGLDPTDLAIVLAPCMAMARKTQQGNTQGNIIPLKGSI